jgi:ribonuclease P protein component
MRKENRLVSEADFRRVRQEGRSWSHPLLVLHVRRSSGQTFRAGVSVGKRFGGAVRRNRLRRQVRELLRARLPELSPGWDVVISPRQQAGSATFAELGDAVDLLLGRARLRAQPPPTAAGRPDGPAT